MWKFNLPDFKFSKISQMKKITFFSLPLPSISSPSSYTSYRCTVSAIRHVLQFRCCSLCWVRAMCETRFSENITDRWMTDPQLLYNSFHTRSSCMTRIQRTKGLTSEIFLLKKEWLFFFLEQRFTMCWGLVRA